MEKWMTDELVKDIPVQKLEFLSNMMQKKNSNDPRQVMKQMLPMMKEAKEKGLQFTSQEVSAAIAAIRKYSAPKENERISQLLKKANYQDPKS